MWKLWNKLFGWQYARINKGYSVYIIRMRYFGYEEWYGKYPYLNKVWLDLSKWEMSGDCPNNFYPLTDKLTDKRQKATIKDNVITLQARIK